MPWKECSVMDERLQFVARRLADEQMADLCREFVISRKTVSSAWERRLLLLPKCFGIDHRQRPHARGISRALIAPSMIAGGSLLGFLLPLGNVSALKGKGKRRVSRLYNFKDSIK
jgi:hypothetical protein